MLKRKKTCTVLYSLLAILNLLGAIAAILCVFLYNDIPEPPIWANVPRPSETTRQFLEPAIEMFVVAAICSVCAFLCRRGQRGIVISLLVALMLIILAIFDYVSAFHSGIEIDDHIEFAIDAGISLALVYFLFQRFNAVRNEMRKEGSL